MKDWVVFLPDEELPHQTAVGIILQDPEYGIE
jgi:hypothetical protein